MGTHLFNIPTVISHSSFKDTKNKTIHLSEKEINYFYSLLYLYRENLLKDNKKESVFLKSNDKENIINPSFKNYKVDIDLVEFNRLEVVGNYEYKDLETFLLKLYYTKIEVNIFGKNRNIKSEIIDMIETISINEKNKLYIKFTEKFGKMILHTNKYFMKVDLNILYKISGYKSKKLYLIFKDYSNLPQKNIIFTKNELGEIIDVVPQKQPLNNILKNINTIGKDKLKTDIEIPKNKDEDYYSPVGNKKIKDYQFNFINLTKKKLTKTTTKKKEIDTEVMEKSKKILQKMKDKGVKIPNEEGYLHTTYTNEMKKQNPTPIEKNKFDIEVENWISNSINDIKNNTPAEIHTHHNNYLMIVVGNDDFFIQNDYKIFDRMRNKTVTNNSEETIRILNNNNLNTKVFCGFGSESKNLTISRIK